MRKLRHNATAPPVGWGGLAQTLGALTLGCGLMGGASPAAAQKNPPVPPDTNAPPATPRLDDITSERASLKFEKHQIGVSADYLAGFGELSLPFGFALQNVGFVSAASVDLNKRDSTYFGASVSYSYGGKWFLDLSFAQGSSSASALKELDIFAADVKYEIDDTWYQLYVRYMPELRLGRLSAYIRAGVTFVHADLSAKGGFNDNEHRYVQDTALEEVQGNLGFGLGYPLVRGSRARLSAVVEGEGFAGSRTQDISEDIFNPNTSISILGGAAAEKLDNLVYGGLGRGVFRFEFFTGDTGRLRVFADAGIQARYTIVEYPEALGSSAKGFGELLWGPYAKVGLKYSF
jgi:hypothetical protein